MLSPLITGCLDIGANDSGRIHEHDIVRASRDLCSLLCVTPLLRVVEIGRRVADAIHYVLRREADFGFLPVAASKPILACLQFAQGGEKLCVRYRLSELQWVKSDNESWSCRMVRTGRALE